MPWFKGNTHTHTSRSDGDTELDSVVEWYAARNYDWLAITDHWQGLSRDEVNRLSDKYEICVVPGNEFSGTAHVVGLGVTDDISKEEYTINRDAASHLQTGVDVIRDLGGVPILAHPKWLYRWDLEELVQIKDCNVFEVHNAAPDCNTFAAGGERGTDELWDDALNAGLRLYGVGSDDSHHYDPDKFHTKHTSAHGAEGWTYVECGTCDEVSILKAIDTGKCVASSGPGITQSCLIDGSYVIEIDEPYEWFRFTTTFIGNNGLLATEHGRSVSYQLTDADTWVRARVFCSSGKYLWTQPVFPNLIP